MKLCLQCQRLLEMICISEPDGKNYLTFTANCMQIDANCYMGVQSIKQNISLN